MTNLEPKIYVACLAAYNNGFLHGKWINANQDSNSLFLEVNKILETSPIPDAEEFAIHDFEDFGGVLIEEYTSLNTISEIASYIAEHGELAAAILAHTGNDILEAKKIIEECYQGEFDSEEDFAYHWTNEVNCTQIPKHLQYYIDYKEMARDFFINDFFSLEINNKTHVFNHY